MACSPRLTTRKRGEGVKHSRSPTRLPQQSCPKSGIPLTRERILRASFFRNHSGAYYSKTGSVRNRITLSIIHKIRIMWILFRDPTSTHFSLQCECGSIEPGVLLPPNILQLEHGGSGSSRKIDDSELCRTVTTRQRRVIDSEDGI